MHRFGARPVELAVHDSGAGGDALQVIGAQCLHISHAVFVGQSAGEDVGENLHVLVPVRAESPAWADAVLVDHAEGSEAHVFGVVVAGEGKGVGSVQPAVIGMAALVAFANVDHGVISRAQDILCRGISLDSRGSVGASATMKASLSSMARRSNNTLSQQVEEFTPASQNTVRMYTCGPTVYDFAHIGNFRTFTFVDLLRKCLRANGFQLNHVMNITDVDDKIIRNAVAAHQTLAEY